jgi:hypothetical protein
LVIKITEINLLGIDFALFTTVLWPSVSYCVPSKYMGLALGLITAMVNFGCMICPIIITSIKNNFNNINYIIF